MATCFHFKGKTTPPLSCMKSKTSPPKALLKLTSVKVAQNQSYWASIESEIESYLRKAIPGGIHETVLKPMNHFIFTTPQTRAPALCVVACELVGGDRSKAMAAASAIHVMHASAKSHEDLLLTDVADPESRPYFSTQTGFAPNIKLLLPDAIVPFGLEMLARSMDLAENEPDKILRVIMEITRAVGSEGVVDGQYREFVLDRLSSRDDWDVIEYVCRKKEGEMHACGAACGAILGGGAEDEIEKLRKYGLLSGMIYGMLVKNKPGKEEKIEELKNLALKELESFKGKNTELIFSLVEPSVSRVRI